MKKGDFIPLIELQSISNELERLESNVKEELNRLDYLDTLNSKNEEKVISTQAKIQELTKETILKEGKLESLEKSLEKTKANLMLSKSNEQLQSMEEQISAIDAEINLLEEEIILDLDKVESLKKELHKYYLFQENFPETYAELKNEIYKENKVTFNKVESKKERQKQLLGELPEELRKSFESLSKKINPPVTFIEINRCSSCKTIQDNMTLQSIRLYTEVNYCFNCGRILIEKDIMY